MDRELLLIELISAKDEIIAFDQKNKNRILVTLFAALLFCGAFFFGLATLTHQFLLAHVHLLLYRSRIEKLYQFSMVFGGILMALILALMIYSLIHSFYINHRYQPWATKQIAKMLKYPKIYQDSSYYYLAKKDQLYPKIRLARADIQSISTTFDDQQLLLGEERQVLGISTSRFLLLSAEPPRLARPLSGTLNKNIKLALTLSAAFLIGFFGVYQYATSYATDAEWEELWAQQAEEDPGTTTDDGQTDSPVILDGLATQQGSAPLNKTSEANSLFLQANGDLFVTTDHGENWQYLPLAYSWLRFGSYRLTAGNVVEGQYMDKTYEISPEFSWFLYSPDADSGAEKMSVYLLYSHDGGVTWQRSLISNEISQTARYRKATFFSGGYGLFMVSFEDPSTSEEVLRVFSTNDQGASWQSGRSATIPRPVQNVSFLNQMTGFVATREKLFYTFNGGTSYKEALVNLPAEYQLGGLDLFQTPSEISQVSTNTLEAKFYLTRNDDYKMYACLFRSTDNGETWNFQQQLDELTKYD